MTVNDLWNIVPPNPPVSTVELTGQEMWDMIEDNLEHTLAVDPYQQMGGYVKRCLGLTLYVKLENPAGSRIQQIFTGSEELKRDATYTAAFVTTQGVPKKYGRNRRSHRRPQSILRRPPVRERGSPWHGDRRLIQRVKNGGP